MFHCTLLTMTSVNLLGSILVCLVASPTSATPLGSTSSPQESYQQYLKSLAVPKLGSTRAPFRLWLLIQPVPTNRLYKQVIFISKISLYNCCMSVCFNRTHMLNQFLTRHITSVLLNVILFFSTLSKF